MGGCEDRQHVLFAFVIALVMVMLFRNSLSEASAKTSLFLPPEVITFLGDNTCP
jgi:hypothetical protein